ncbi:MAG TPA: 4'-phosphopantetheinyl transferase superfamily protein [Acidobacteriaceae bacterium]|jgi:phosphopantetheine--protein transferase-like protein|nr:4'-phosphopantetheinyl transferase superfamily protein [Acidobacteriaceae bacterium]
MTAEVLRELVASLGGKDKAEITDATALGSALQGSLGLVRLEGALRYKLGISNPKIGQTSTFGDLCSALGVARLDGTGPEATPVQELPPHVIAFAQHSAPPHGVHVGIDVEAIAALPEASDYWEHDFYKSTFSPREIAYALLQPSPRATFAGQWCAKEALRKANSDLANAKWTSLEVVHDPSGKPEMTVDGRPAFGALSVSHSADVAVAVFVAAEPTTQCPTQESKSAINFPSTAPPWGGMKAFTLALLALLVAVAALMVAFLHR